MNGYGFFQCIWTLVNSIRNNLDSYFKGKPVGDGVVWPKKVKDDFM